MFFQPWGAAAPCWTPTLRPCTPISSGSSEGHLVARCLRGKPSDEQPNVKWDIAKSPHHAEWLDCGPNSLQAMFDEDATIPMVKSVWMAIDNPITTERWGNIEVKNDQDAISVWDILNAIYEYFNEPITRRDLDYLQRLDSSNHAMILEAARARVNGQPGSTPAFLGTRGMKRVDALGDMRKFWGMWVVTEDGGWHLKVALK
ncbi:hypothetical protein HWV62_15062 [Athelia sp. TMB]|nr:hypothetical protein HWV62_32993 [Athelia sp. TMB]KAF7973467.1 hypothetical protein HWV62_15062 [Athelia sp. TMB]